MINRDKPAWSIMLSHRIKIISKLSPAVSPAANQRVIAPINVVPAHLPAPDSYFTLMSSYKIRHSHRKWPALPKLQRTACWVGHYRKLYVIFIVVIIMENASDSQQWPESSYPSTEAGSGHLSTGQHQATRSHYIAANYLGEPKFTSTQKLIQLYQYLAQNTTLNEPNFILLTPSLSQLSYSPIFIFLRTSPVSSEDQFKNKEHGQIS